MRKYAVRSFSRSAISLRRVADRVPNPSSSAMRDITVGNEVALPMRGMMLPTSERSSVARVTTPLTGFTMFGSSVRALISRPTEMIASRRWATSGWAPTSAVWHLPRWHTSVSAPVHKLGHGRGPRRPTPRLHVT